MVVEISPEFEARLNSWSEVTQEPPQKFIYEALDEALGDWEDYRDALTISALVAADKMKTYSREEVERELDEMDG